MSFGPEPACKILWPSLCATPALARSERRLQKPADRDSKITPSRRKQVSIAMLQGKTPKRAPHLALWAAVPWQLVLQMKRGITNDHSKEPDWTWSEGVVWTIHCGRTKRAGFTVHLLRFGCGPVNLQFAIDIC